MPHIHGGLNGVLDYSNYRIETGERFVPAVESRSSPNVGEGQNRRQVRKGERAFYYWIYPNLMINIYDGVMDTNLVIPRGIDKTEVIFDYYFADVSEQARKHNLASIAVSEQIQAEDVAICESVQRGLNSRSYSYRPAVSSARSWASIFSQAAACGFAAGAWMTNPGQTESLQSLLNCHIAR